MTKTLFVVLTSVATLAALGAVKRRYNFQLSPPVHPFVVSYRGTTSHVRQGQAQPVRDNDRYFTLAVRSDGATMRANAIPDAQGRLVTVRAIEFKDRYVVVDHFSKSVSTYKPYMPMVVATQDCGGVPDTPILGYRTEAVTQNAKPNPAKYREETVTKWLAVDLNCMSLRERYVNGDGTEIVQVEREAISVQVGEPPVEYFDVPTDYQERGPAEVDSEMQKKFGQHVFGKGDPAVLEKLQQTYRNPKPQ